jgi:hypothetical protein
MERERRRASKMYVMQCEEIKKKKKKKKKKWQLQQNHKRSQTPYQKHKTPAERT